jgi:biotin carboxyl carrier protein
VAFRRGLLAAHPRHLAVLDAAVSLAGEPAAGRAHGVALHQSFGSIVAQVAETASHHLAAPARRVCSAEVPMPYARHLEAAALPLPPRIVEAARALCAQPGGGTAPATAQASPGGCRSAGPATAPATSELGEPAASPALAASAASAFEAQPQSPAATAGSLASAGTVATSTSQAFIDLTLPSLGADMDDGTLVQWKVAVGDPVRRGQVVALVDTAKVRQCFLNAFEARFNDLRPLSIKEL